MFSTKDNSEVEEVDATMYGQCRCCLANGQHRDVTKEYYFNNMKEVYKDIFLECFNLSLSPHNLISSLICEKCVHRLRDASRFRMMVSATEAQLLKAIVFKSEPDDDTEIVADQQNFATEIKIENAEEYFDMEEEFSQESSEGSVFSEGTNEDEWMSDGERMNEDERKEYERMIEQRMKEDDEDDDWSSGSSENELVIDETREIAYSDSDTDDDVDGVGNDDCESTYSSITMSTTSALDDEPCQIIEGEQKLLCRFPTSPPPPLPKRNELRDLCPLYNQHLIEFGEKIVKPESIGWYFNLPELNEKILSEKQALTVNASTIFQYSNATAFKTKTRKGYTCFYCREAYKFDKLKEHQKKHSKTSISKLLSKFNADEFVVYADITNLKCTICKKKIKSIKKLKKHLTKKHGRKIYPSADRVIPFKLTDTDFECQKCRRKFDTFCAVEKHMNTHFGTFKCRDCGATFITKHRLAVHNYDQHKDEKVVCDICKKSFRTQLKYRQHYDGVHKNIKKLKCSQCPEKFIDFFTRQKHLVDVHSEAPLLYKCNVCDKGFNRRFSLSSHVKRCHTDKKNIKCLECPYTCYTNSELKDHVIKHQTPQKFECPICKKTYGRNRTLVTHLKTHKDHT